MSAPVNTINNSIASFTSAFPNNIVKSAVQGAVFSFTISTIFSGNPVYGLVSAALSATATLVDALVRPLMDKIFEGLRTDSVVRLVVNSVVVMSAVSGLTVLAVPYVGAMKGVDIASTAMLNLVCGILFGLRHNTCEATTYVTGLTMVRA